MARRWPSEGAHPRRALVADLAIATGSFAAFTLPELVSAWASADGHGDGYGSPTAVAVYGALAVMPLVARRRWPAAALAGVVAVLCAASLTGVRFTPFVSNAGPALAIAAATIASRRPRRASLAGCAAAAVATSAAGLLALPLHPEQDQDAVQLALVAVSWLVGDALRTRREYRQGLELAHLRQRAEQEQRVRAEERLRLSRDVHDIVSHTLSMITIRAGVARLLLANGPPEAANTADTAETADPAEPAEPAETAETAETNDAREALAVIETASRSALDELRRILRQTRTAGSGEAVAAPTLADVEALVEAVRGQGLEVTFRVLDPARAAGTVDPESGGMPGRPDYPLVLETSAYRIVQEALTNVTRHAAADHAWVEIVHHRDELVVSVLDDGRGRHPGAVPGIGLAGMRERAELFGGVIEAGPRPDGGGFAVVARFPVAPHER
ncbi:sensor histidine kinase [Pseudofrankia asymbiotica]|uniref:histidine kinase n=1 Tax=Pseudofrankia asymbiotica TaxID=1834516 RepID=A0A1V2I706_9ACTN|nr:sensor histidine kinase [Pseudofrankia asymbiotica]